MYDCSLLIQIQHCGECIVANLIKAHLFPLLSLLPLSSLLSPSLYLSQPLCPKELWHFVHQCYGNELGLTSDDEDYVPPDDDFNTMG